MVRHRDKKALGRTDGGGQGRHSKARDIGGRRSPRGGCAGSTEECSVIPGEGDVCQTAGNDRKGDGFSWSGRIFFFFVCECCGRPLFPSPFKTPESRFDHV